MAGKPFVPDRKSWVLLPWTTKVALADEQESANTTADRIVPVHENLSIDLKIPLQKYLYSNKNGTRLLMP